MTDRTIDLAPYEDKKYSIRLAWDKESNCWFASHPELPGCFADGKSISGAVRSLKICRDLWIESRLSVGFSIPEPAFVSLDLLGC
jgi:predicted RNase H-like HicB family nuclease